MVWTFFSQIRVDNYYGYLYVKSSEASVWSLSCVCHMWRYLFLLWGFSIYALMVLCASVLCPVYCIYFDIISSSKGEDFRKSGTLLFGNVLLFKCKLISKLA